MSKKVNFSDMPLEDRILHKMRIEQDKQRDAHNQACERLRPDERPTFRPHVKVPSPELVKAAKQSEVQAVVARLVQNGRLLPRHFGEARYEVADAA